MDNSESKNSFYYGSNFASCRPPQYRADNMLTATILFAAVNFILHRKWEIIHYMFIYPLQDMHFSWL